MLTFDVEDLWQILLKLKIEKNSTLIFLYFFSKINKLFRLSLRGEVFVTVVVVIVVVAVAVAVVGFSTFSLEISDELLMLFSDDVEQRTLEG